MPLRIALILDSFVQPRWVRRALEKILASNVATIEIVVNVGQRTDSGGGLLYKLYERVDRSLFAADAVESISVEDLLTGVKISHGFEQIKAADLHVIVNFGPNGLNAELATAATYGVWFYDFGAAPGFEEVMNQVPVTVSTLKSLQGDEERVIYESVSPTLSRFSVR